MSQMRQKVGETRTGPVVIHGLSFVIFVGVGLVLVTILTSLERHLIPVRWEDDPLKVFGICIMIVFLHELSHYVAYLRIAKLDRNDVYLGFDKRWLVLFCGCRVPITVSNQRKALMAPLITTGIACTFVFCLSLSYWSAIALSFTFGTCAKDIVDFVKLRKFSGDCIIAGCRGSIGTSSIFETMPQ